MAGYVGSPPAMTADQWEYMRASGMGGSDPQQQQQVIHVRPEKFLWGSMVHHRVACMYSWLQNDIMAIRYSSLIIQVQFMWILGSLAVHDEVIVE